MAFRPEDTWLEHSKYITYLEEARDAKTTAKLSLERDLEKFLEAEKAKENELCDLEQKIERMRGGNRRFKTELDLRVKEEVLSRSEYMVSG